MITMECGTKVYKIETKRSNLNRSRIIKGKRKKLSKT